MQKNRLKNEKGITLVTLVITIIVLLILAGISLTGITGNNGLSQKSADAKNSAEVKSEMNLIEVASNSARGKNRYGNISADNLQKELNISAGSNKTEVEEELDENDKIGYKITFLDSKRYYFVYNEGEDAEILFIGTVEKDTSKGIIHANPRRKKVNINTSEKVKILLRVFSNIDNNKINLSYGWSKSSYKEPDSYIDVTVDGTGNDKTTDASYPNETGDWYLFVKARINNEEEMLKVFGKYSVVAENVSTSTQKYTVIYEKGENVLSIGARYDTTTGEIKLPSITAENGYKDNGWYENDEYVGKPGTTITINRNLTLTAEAQDNEKPTVKIAREDYDTFSWEAKDKEKINGYIITKSEKEPSIEDSGWKEDGILTSGTHDIDSASTYYVYVRDEKGNIGKASIDAYLVTREQETGTTLITRVDGTSNETGIPVTENIAVLNNTKIYVEASATDGHTDVTINAGTKDVTNPGIITIQKNTIILSHAEFKELILAFNANGGTGTMPNQTIVYGTATNLSANTFTKTGYTFTGWNTKADGSGTSYTDGQSILITKEDTPKLETLYAQWTENQYKITYDYNVNNYTYQNDSFIDTNYTINWDEDFEIDSVVNIPTLGQRYLIAGNFYTTSSTSKDISLEITTGNKLRVWINGAQRGVSTATIAAGTDITFHFSWVASTKKYTFTSTGTNSNVTVTGTYDVTGSANKTLRQGMKDHRESGAAYKTMTTKSLKITKKHKYSTSLSNLPSAATKTGYTLNGWFTSATGGTQVSTSTTVPAENKTYYAQWEISKYTLTINPNGGTWNGETTNTTITQNYDTTYKVTNNPTRAGYLFTGWTLSGNGNYSYYDTSVTPTETKTFNYNSASSTVPTVYNNSGGGTVTDSMVADSTATGKYSLKVTTNGTATPGAGGVHVDAWPTTPGRINVLEVKAKIPTGYSLLLSGIGEVYTGIGANYRYNDNAGTGAWKTYYLVTYSGDTGSFSPTAYLYLSGTNNKSVTWNINSIVMKSYTKSQFKTIYKFGIGNGTLTANWAVSGSKVIFNANNGTYNTTYVKNWTNGYNGTSATSAYRCYYYGTAYGTYPGNSDYNWTPDTRVISRTGYIFDGWYTSTSEGTKVFNANGTLVPSLSGYSDSSGKWIKYDGNVTLYARWIQASYKVSSPSMYTTNIKDAIEVAESGATITFLLTSKTDNTTANINKTLTLNLNGGTLTRNVPINVTAGNFTVQGSSNGSVKGTLFYDNTTDSSAIINTGASSSVKIQNYADIRSKATAIKFETSVTNGNLNISNSLVHSEGAYSAIKIGRANAVDISSSYIFSPYGYPGTIYVDVLPSLTISGNSRVGGGTTQDNNSSAARGVIVFSLAEQSTTTKLTLNGNAILMAGNYCKQAVLANRKINVDISGEAEVYSNNGPCFTHWVSGSIININTSGWVYANGSYVVAAGTNSIDVRLSRGTLVAQTQYMVYGGGTGKYISQTNTHNHDFYVMNAYNSYSTKQFSNLYEYGLGFVKVGQSSSYVWTYQDVTRKHGWNDIHGYRYYFWDSTKSSTDQHLAADDNTKYIDGQVVTKWLYVNGGWYYLTPSSTNADPVSSTHGRMHTEHLYLGTNHYFLAPSYNFTTYKNKELSGTYTFNYGQMVYGYIQEYKGDGPWWFDPADGVSR